MNKLRSFPVTNHQTFKKPELLQSYPDIDYEMIPIKDDNSYLAGQSKPFHFDQLSFASLKDVLKKAKHFDLIHTPISKISNYLVEKSFSKREVKCIAIVSKSDLTLLIPLEQISACKKTKKYTKIFLNNGKQLKTSIKFKKLKKCLLKNGFSKD